MIGTRPHRQADHPQQALVRSRRVDRCPDAVEHGYGSPQTPSRLTPMWECRAFPEVEGCQDSTKVSHLTVFAVVRFA